MSIIKLKNLSYSYSQNNENKKLAVDDISLEIEEGSFVAIVGHNGSGKSTLAKLLNGLLMPTNGTVHIADCNTCEESNIFKIRSNVGMVFQNPDNQMVASIIEDDIAFGPENLGIERLEIIRRVEWALRKVGMLEHRKGTPFKLSGGQKQRISIAGVLAIMPKIIVFDESTAMLDPKGRAEVLKVAYDLNKNEGITIILITHFMDEAMQADRVLVMNEGKIIADDVPKNIFTQHKMLKSINLDVPMVTQIAINLNRLGLDISTNIFEEEELVDKLCQLL